MPAVVVVNQPGVLLYDANGNPITSVADGLLRRLHVHAQNKNAGLIGAPVPADADYLGGIDPSGNLQGLALDALGQLKVVLASPAGAAVTLISRGSLASGASTYYEYTVPAGKTLKLTSFYTGGAPGNSSAGAVRASLMLHTDSTVQFVENGDFESAGDVTEWAAVTGSFTAPTPDSNGTQFQTGTKSMRWTYSASATALRRRNTLTTKLDITLWRYMRVRFYNDAATGTTRTISIVLTSGGSTRTYSLSGTLGSAPFTSNTWITLTADLQNPTSSTGTAFDETQVDSVDLVMQDGANKTGTVYWDTLRMEDALDFKHLVYSANGSSVNVLVAPEAYPEGSKLYLRTKNTNNASTEFCTVSVGVLE